MTASAMQGDRERCLAAGMDDYVTKPISRERLEHVIERWTVSSSSPPATDPTTVVQPAIQSTPLDAQRLQEIAGGDPVKAQRYLTMFANSTESILSELDAAVCARALDDAARVAHKLKGVCAMIGAQEMATLSTTMEHAVGEGSWGEAERLRSELREALERALAASARV